MVLTGGTTVGAINNQASGSRTISNITPSKVVYLEPTNYENPTAYHPAAVGKLLTDAGFTRCREITKIGKFRFQLELESESDFAQLSTVNLDSGNLKIFVPQGQKHSLVFVPVPVLDFSEVEMSTSIITSAPVKKV